MGGVGAHAGHRCTQLGISASANPARRKRSLMSTTDVTVTVTVHDSPQGPAWANTVAVALTVLLVAYAFGWLGWLVAAAVVYIAARVGWWWYTQQLAAQPPPSGNTPPSRLAPTSSTHGYSLGMTAESMGNTRQPRCEMPAMRPPVSGKIWKSTRRANCDGSPPFVDWLRDYLPRSSSILCCISRSIAMVNGSNFASSSAMDASVLSNRRSASWADDIREIPAARVLHICRRGCRRRHCRALRAHE